MRVILDTNIWISGLLFGGNPLTIIKLARKKRIQVFSTEALMSELEEVLNYQKFLSRLERLRVTSQEILLIVRELISFCPEVLIEAPANLRDSDDLLVLAAAVSASAVVIVYGDSDLFILNPFSGISIMTATDFLNEYFPSINHS